MERSHVSRVHPSFPEIPWWGVPAVAVGLPVLVAVLAVLFPQAVGEGFVVRYFRGPVIEGGPNNIVNTAAYGVVVVLGIVGLTQFVDWASDRLGMTIRDVVPLTVVAWIVAASLLRIVEDTGAIAAPWNLVFVPPFIQVAAVFAAFGTGALGIVLVLRGGMHTGRTLVALALGMLAVWTMLWTSFGPTAWWLHPAWILVALAATVPLSLRWARGSRPLDAQRFFPIPLLALWLVVLPAIIHAGAVAEGNHAGAVGGLLVAWGAVSAALAGLAYWMRRRGASGVVAVLAAPLSLLVVISQLLDGMGTAFFVEHLGATEKQVVAAAIIEGARGLALGVGWDALAASASWWSFVPLKALLGVGAVLVLDRWSGIPADRHVALRMFIKLTLVVFGLGPAITSLGRVALG